jgi:flagellin-like protein
VLLIYATRLKKKVIGENGMKANRKIKEEEEAVSAVIGVILMVAITVAIAATVYVYVSGMMGGGIESTPSLSMTKDLGETSIIITIGTVTDTGVLWSNTNYTFVDLTAGSAITTDVTFPTTGTISGGDIIKCENLTDLSEYRFTITYTPTGGTMGTISWTQ